MSSRSRSRSRFALLALRPLLVLVVLGCDDKEPSSGSALAPSTPGTHNAGSVIIPTGGACHVVVADQAPLPAPHLPTCSYIPYDQSNPPSSGPHYPVWARYKTYTSPVPRGFLVHDLEHGGLVVSYDCPGGCAGEVAKAQAVIDAFVDPGCSTEPAGESKRVTLSPDPLLDTTFALAAWGHTLTASCVDEAAFAAFMKAYAGKGPEDVCGGGSDVLASPLPAKCGEADITP